MWYHHVEQGRCPNETENDADDDSQQYTIAVNFWHDMRFDDRFATARFLETARERARGWYARDVLKIRKKTTVAGAATRASATWSKQTPHYEYVC